MGTKRKPEEGRFKPGGTVEEAVALGDLDSRFFVTLCARFVSYRDFLEVEPGGPILGVDTFRLILGVATYDCFTDRMDDAAKAAKLSVSPADLQALREHPSFPKIRAALLDKARTLSLPNSFEKWAEIAEDLMAREGLRIATFAQDPKDRLAAAKEFGDRRSAKKGRDTAPGVFIVPEGLARQIDVGLRFMDMLKTAAAGREIDGSVLNVPKLVGKGSTGGEP